MDAGAVAFSLLFVTGRAVDRLQRNVIVGMLGRGVGVATDAVIGLVRGSREFGCIHEQRNSVSGGIGDGERLVRVTIQAIAVLQASPGRQGKCQQGQDAERQMLQSIHNIQI